MYDLDMIMLENEYNLESLNDILESHYDVYKICMLENKVDDEKRESIIQHLSDFVNNTFESVLSLSKKSKFDKNVYSKVQSKLKKDWKSFKKEVFGYVDSFLKKWYSLDEHSRMKHIAIGKFYLLYDMDKIKGGITDMEIVILRKYYDILYSDISDPEVMKQKIEEWDNFSKKMWDDYWANDKNLYTKFRISEVVEYTKRIEKTYEELIEKQTIMITHVQAAIDKLFERYNEIADEYEKKVEESAKNEMALTEVTGIKKITNIFASFASKVVNKIVGIFKSIGSKLSSIAKTLKPFKDKEDNVKESVSLLNNPVMSIY